MYGKGGYVGAARGKFLLVYTVTDRERHFRATTTFYERIDRIVTEIGSCAAKISHVILIPLHVFSLASENVNPQPNSPGRDEEQDFGKSLQCSTHSSVGRASPFAFLTH